MSPPTLRDLLGASPSTASPSDSTLVIIDAQNEYASGKLAVSDAPSTRKAIAALLEKYRKANGKIFHIVHSVPDGAPVFTPKTELAEEFDELKPKDGEKVVKKQHPSAFAETELHEQLGGGKVVLVGYMVSDRAKKCSGIVLMSASPGARLRVDLCSRCIQTWLRCPHRRRCRGRSRHPRRLGRGCHEDGHARACGCFCNDRAEQGHQVDSQACRINRPLAGRDRICSIPPWPK